MIKIEGTLRATTDKQLVAPDRALKILRQVLRDAQFGTFGELPTYFYTRWRDDPAQYIDLIDIAKRDDCYDFSLVFSEALFPVDGGLQHLLGILAGDLFYMQIPGLTLAFEIRKIEIPSQMQADILTRYRGDGANTIDAIRSQFRLASHEPLLAFSFKPRYGLKQEAIKEITLGVLRNGFHIVEMDTRELLSANWLTFYLQLAREAERVDESKQRITRFSPNLSFPPHTAVDLARPFLTDNSLHPPYVLKVDGGLDGLSTLQALRREFRTQKPIITCYPLLRDRLHPFVPPDFFNWALAASGADILYPGGRPRLNEVSRSLGASERGGVQFAAVRYRKLLKQGWPMPSIAGGVYPGLLHAYHVLLGPKIAYFLGGGVALHKDGPIPGAELCVKVVHQACDPNRENAPLDERLQQEIGEAFASVDDAHFEDAEGKKFSYLRPELVPK